MMGPVMQLDLESDDPETRAVAAVRDAIDQAKGDLIDRIVDYIERQKTLGRLSKDVGEFADDLLTELGAGT